VSSKRPESWVLGADTVVVIQGTLLGKPGSMDEARDIFDQLNGKTHRVVTAVFLMRERPFHQMPFYDVSHVTFHKLTDRERDEYLAAIDPFDKAGAYAVQDRAEKVIKEIQGSVTNVMGLPMEKLTEVLERITRHSSSKMPRPGGYGYGSSPRSSLRSPYMLKSWR
jgi:septum formation protein